MNPYINVINPYNGQRVGTLPIATTTQVEQVVSRAKRAAQDFRFSTPHERRHLLNRLADLVARDADELSNTITKEMGKTLKESRNEIRRAEQTLRLSGDAATFLDGEVVHCAVAPGCADRQAVITHVPTGVVGAITPFNYPVNLLCHKLGPAIAAGNGLVVKPSPKAPLAADAFIRLCQEAGFPTDLVQVIHGGSATALSLAQSHIDLLTFTGGSVAGLALKRAAGLVRCLMELGGNDPLFVLPDADLNKAVSTVVEQRFEIAGQSCAAIKKLYLHRDIATQFTEALVEKMQGHRYGDPSNEQTQMGPVIDDLAANDIMSRVQEAIDRGARLLAGATREGNLLAPTILMDVPVDCRLFAKETFGPVVAIRTFSDVDEVINEINKTDYGLQAGLFTNDHAIVRKFAKNLQVGGLMVNEGPDFRADHVPFGGIKSSGLGREGVRIAIREMSEQHVLIDA